MCDVGRRVGRRLIAKDTRQCLKARSHSHSDTGKTVEALYPEDVHHVPALWLAPEYLGWTSTPQFPVS